jgi:hypothetical protein
MYGDTRVIRGLAGSLRERGEQVRREATTLLTLADATPWQGLAADAMRARARSGADALRHTADLHDEAADALDAHADAVDRLKALIARIEHAVTGLVEAAKHRLAGLAGMVATVVPDPVDEFFDHFVPPPPGHKDWLSLDLPVHIPGLG